MPKPVPANNVAKRSLSEYYDFFSNTLFTVGEKAPRKGAYLPSQGINTVDEVPDSAWYTNRHATRRSQGCASTVELRLRARSRHRPP